jgi:prepilin peptidase CpaA
MMLTVLALAVFAGLLVFAACYDVARLLIPNWVSIALAASFPLFALAHGLTTNDVGIHLAFGFAILVVGYFLFNANIIGGGDAKLLAAAATWTGFAAFTPLIFWMALSGGVMALVLMRARKWMPYVEGAPAFVNRLLIRGGGIPYGVAIMCGGLASIPQLLIVLGR